VWFLGQPGNVLIFNKEFLKIIDKKLGYIKTYYYLYYVLKMIDMRQTEQKALDYLKSNPIVAEFIEKLNETRKEYYEKAGMPNQYKEVIVEVGNKFIRIWHGTSCWGFISRVDDVLKGAPIKKGDLLKAATWKAPAKHARGNIIDGTARYGVYGPEYL
jgi:hypothetical protein